MRSVLREAISTADLVHIHSIWNGTVTVAAAISRVTGRPWIISPRGMLDPDNLARRRWLKRLYYAGAERRTLAGAAGWHFLSESERERCAWVPGLSARPYAIAPNGIDVEGIAESIRRSDANPLGDGAVHLAFLGRLHPIKGLDLQVEVLKQLVARGIDARLTLIGPDAGTEGPVRAAAEQLGVGDRVQFTGPIYGEGRFRRLRDADAVLLTSHYEANSNTVNETLASGGVLIAAETCGVDAPAQAGALVQVPRAAESVTNAVVDLLADPDRAAHIRGRAQAYARATLDWNPISRAVRDLYRTVLDIDKGERGCAA
jgi:glycosyltransferase involved in cell wall biosynthesis